LFLEAFCAAVKQNLARMCSGSGYRSNAWWRMNFGSPREDGVVMKVYG